MLLNSAPGIRPCPACGGRGCAPEGKLNGWEMARCPGCKLWFSCAVPAPEELAALYNKVYESGGLYQPHLEEIDALQQHGHAKVGYYRSAVFLNRYKPSPGDKLLEVGCGVGSFLVAASRKGWDAEGIDLSQNAISASSMVHKLPVRQGTLESLPFESGAYAAVVCWEVLEHLAAPQAFLARARSLLRERGLFVCSVPNSHPRVPQAEVLGAASVPPIHLNFWDCESFRKFLELNSFRPLLLKSQRSMLTSLDYRKHPARFIARQLGRLVGFYQGPNVFAVATPAGKASVSSPRR
jgi:2-polyprenyl-3-methyl-5-hydroxy-6-metoxy-1,4-benzoquinol methylase